MRIVVFLVLLYGFCEGTAALSEGGNLTTYAKYEVTDKDLLKKTEQVLKILYFINQPSFYKEFVDIAKNYSIYDQENKFTNEHAFKKFLQHYQKGILPRGTQFSVFYDEHLKQAVDLFKLLYYAKDFDTFFKTAVWARQNFNEALFLYSFSVALKHRNDTYKIILPPIYELNPHYFVTSDYIYEAQKLKQLHNHEQLIINEPYVVMVNYTGQNLDYFLEDVGLNAYYYYFNLFYPFWFGGDEFNMKNDRRGELFYYVHQQLLARYYLERVSNHLGDVPVLEYPKEPPFSSLVKHNKNLGLKNVHDVERRIVDAIDAGFVYTEKGEKIDILTPEGFNIIGNIIEGNADSVNKRFYGRLQIFVRQLLNLKVPSVLDHFETSLRGPIYWEFVQRMVVLLQSHKLHFPKYSSNELNFPGVKIEGLEVDPLVTYFDDFDFDITSSILVNAQEFANGSFRAVARQQRLNNKPFSYTVNITSDKEQQAVVRTFIGPKHDLIDINDHRLNFFQFDAFVAKLNAGGNDFERNYPQFHSAQDKTTFMKLRDEISNGDAFNTYNSEFWYGFPQRLILPKGQKSGQKFQFFVIVTPFKGNLAPDNVYAGGILKVGSGNQYIDSLPLGYPFDRAIENDAFVSVQNSFFKDVTVYHT